MRRRRLRLVGGGTFSSGLPNNQNDCPKYLQPHSLIYLQNYTVVELKYNTSTLVYYLPNFRYPRAVFVRGLCQPKECCSARAQQKKMGGECARNPAEKIQHHVVPEAAGPVEIHSQGDVVFQNTCLCERLPPLIIHSHCFTLLSIRLNE